MKATLDDSSFGQGDECDGLFVHALLGDSRAATVIYTRCVPPLREWLTSRLPDCEAEDLAHESFLLALRLGSRCWRGGSLMAWLKTIGRHLAQKRTRSDFRRRRRERDYQEHERRIGGNSDNFPANLQVALNNCLANLSDQQRNLIQMRYFEGRSAHEIAMECGRSRLAVAVSLHRICRQMRDQLKNANTLDQDDHLVMKR